ncbi:endo-1,3(4)-beta-glucanase [Capronia coronata CBS 617.96]|uniref:endo-1,3(4)-beta-glucanase n=1 Tax=Capronia coronata CBS 617.96 TaxID=1182541 RepID=W9YG03_9EURO|nr:endo-1,3(4)-beta-glucanase [Capronia coronata CBS 617.96]EXJ88600.1 endo-1,3(4)-beta-glucanase [Capronia coronata CBS 617.96]
MLASILLALAGLVSLSTAGYVLEDDYTTDEFFSMFNFFTDADPTNGYVTYVDENTAQNGGMISTTNGSIYMGVDYTNVATGSGRNSVRLTSKKSYTHGLIVLDLSHMPGGVCGTWPAFWTVGPNWPEAGEIDIIEGVNLQLGNSMALHTTPGCSITHNGLFSGVIATPNCDVNAAGQPTNAGCAIVTPNLASFGNGFNLGQGGVYATEWTSAGINIWFFPRSAIPSDLASGNPDPSNWGSPTAAFGGGCEIDDFFNSHQIVFDTTFCGDWAGNVWSADPICGAKAPSCQNYVQNNPSAFADAYWSINSLKVYQGSSSGSANGTVSSAPQSATVSASAGVSSASGLPGVSVSVPLLPTPASASGIPTTGFSRGGNGRPTKTWGVAANFAAGVAGSEQTQTPTTEDGASPTVAADAAVTESPDGGVVFAADAAADDDSADFTEYVTVTAVTYEYFGGKDKKKREPHAAAEVAVEKRVPGPIDANVEARSQEAAHLLKHRRSHGNVHRRHLLRHGLSAAKLVEE